MDFSQKGHRKGLKGDSDVTRENVHSKHRGAASSEVAESAAKESTFLLLFPSSPLPFALLLQWPLGLLHALPHENRFFSFDGPRFNFSLFFSNCLDIAPNILLVTHSVRSSRNRRTDQVNRYPHIKL